MKLDGQLWQITEEDIFFAGSRNGANIYRKLVLMKPADDSTSPRYATALYNAIKSHLVVILDTVTSNDDMFKELSVDRN